LIDLGERPFDLGVLQFTLSAIVLKRRLGGVDPRGGLRYLRFVIVVVELDQEVTLVNDLIIVDFHFSNDARDFRAQRGKITTNISIIGYLLNPCSLPADPVTRHCHNHRPGQCDYNQRRQIAQS
jgi:hypothetical protein